MMKFKTISLMSLTLILSLNSYAVGQWKLIWSDEFNYNGLPDKTKWDYEEGFVRNNEMQYYTRDRKKNARVENGMLVIEGHKETLPNPKHKPGSNSWSQKRANLQYTAASLITRNKETWRYGRIEVRAKLPQGKGVWPAIWTLGSDRKKYPWPNCGEIDIMEYIGRLPNTVHGTVHYQLDGKHKSNGSKINTDAPYADFHIYAIEWNHDKIDFFFDDQKYHTFQIDDAGEDNNNSFRRPHYLLINLALGGSWGQEIDDSILPQKYLIDYVRIYKQKQL